MVPQIFIFINSKVMSQILLPLDLRLKWNLEYFQYFFHFILKGIT